MGIFHQPRFDEQLAELDDDLGRIHDALRYVEWQIAQAPDSGVQSKVPGIYRVRTRLPSSGRMVRVSIFYTYDGKDSTFQRLARARNG